MKRMNSIRMWFCTLLAIAFISSCSDDTPVSISRIYTHQQGNTTTELTEIRLGENIRIEGSGFATTKAVYCNGKEVSGINRNLITDTNIIFTVPQSTPIGSEVENAEDLNTIRIVTESDNYVYRIAILCGRPSISGVSHTLAKAGEHIEIYGSNLRGLSTVTFPGNVVVEAGDITESEDYKTLSLIVPEGGDQIPGAICVEGVSGGAYSYNYINCNGGAFLSAFDPNVDAFTKIGTSGGSAVIVQNTAVDEFDGYPEAPSVYCAIPKEPATLDPVAMDGQNAGFIEFNPTKALSIVADDPDSGITRDTPCENLAFQLDYYMLTPWTTGAFRIELEANNTDYRATAYSWWEDGALAPVEFNGWRTLTLPCSDMPALEDVTLGEAMEDLQSVSRALLIFRMGRFDNHRGETMSNCQIYVGNVRLVPYTKQTYSN